VLYAGAVVLEGLMLWLLVRGAGGVVITLAGVLGLVLLLVLDAWLDRQIADPPAEP
jgi:hypothetical protein